MKIVRTERVARKLQLMEFEQNFVSDIKGMNYFGGKGVERAASKLGSEVRHLNVSKGQWRPF